MARKTSESMPTDAGVGYGQPPRRHRIKTGEVRNPWGRRGKPKPSKDFLDETLVIRIDGKAQKLTRDQALDHFLFVRASKGDVRAVQLLKDRSQARRQSVSSPVGGDLSPDEEAAFDRYLHRAAAKLAKEGAR